MTVSIYPWLVMRFILWLSPAAAFLVYAIKTDLNMLPLVLVFVMMSFLFEGLYDSTKAVLKDIKWDFHA